jgi:ribonuclease E
LWQNILEDAQNADCPTLLYQESNLATRVIRDYFTPEILEILIDDPRTAKRVREFVNQVMPRYRSRVKSFELAEPIFSHFGIDEQVGDTMSPEVKLNSGGAIVIDSLEALVAIDVNSGKATAGGNIEETAFRTNLEAADEIARQLRLRDLGGLIVIDFIDMMDRKHKAQVETRMRDAVSKDKARIEVGRLSKFGLMEMSRQRLRASLASQSHQKCPHCEGSGKIKNAEIVALEVMRKIQAAVIVGHVTLVKARLAPGPALFLLNNKKSQLSSLERDHGVQIYILADGRLRPDTYQFEMESARSNKEETEEVKLDENGEPIRQTYADSIDDPTEEKQEAPAPADKEEFAKPESELEEATA